VDVWLERLPPSSDELTEGLRDAEGLLCLLTDQVDEPLLEQCRQLRAISNYAVGSDNVDLSAATARGIPVGNTPGVLTSATADLTMALLLASARQLVPAERSVREGDWLTWEPGRFLGEELEGAVLGIIGLGRIGKAVAERAAGFGMQVIVANHAGVRLAELLERSLFVSIHLPLTDETRGLIGEAELRSMRRDAYLINTARGPIVDSSALARALSEGWIAGAGLDVTDPEPPPPGHPLLEAPNLTLVPHIGSASRRAREAMSDLAVDNLLAALRGEPMPHCVNPEVYGSSFQ
jgi:glyoxylate reductase